jgi:hypothetical protein
MFKLLSFDVYGTLVNTPPANAKAFGTIVEETGASHDDVRRLYRPDGSLKPLAELDDDTRAGIANFEVDEIRVDGAVVRRTTKIKFWDKNAALEIAMRHFGLYERDNTQRAENLQQIQVVLVDAPTDG